MACQAEKVVVVLLRWVVGGVFVYAGLLKALDPAQFAADVDNFRLLPYFMSCAVGVYLPWLEIITGGALALGVWRAGASLLLAAMLVVFLVAMGSAWVRGLDITCGCFGHSSNQTNYPQALLIDLALLASVCVVAWSSGREKSRG